MPGIQHQPPNAAHRAMLEGFHGGGDDGLAAEIAALRHEIAALRAELAPVPGLILTGRNVVEEFKRLNPQPRRVRA